MSGSACVIDVASALRPPASYPLRVVNETCIHPRYCWSLRESARRQPLMGCTEPGRFYACGPSERMLTTITGILARGGEVPRRPRMMQGADGGWPEWTAIVYARHDVVGSVKAFLRAANQGEAFA